MALAGMAELARSLPVALGKSIFSVAASSSGFPC